MSESTQRRELVRPSGRRAGQHLKEAARAVVAHLNAHGSADLAALLALLTPTCEATRKRQYRTLNNLQALGYVERCHVDGVRHFKLTTLGLQAAALHREPSIATPRPVRRETTRPPRPQPPLAAAMPEPTKALEHPGGQWVSYGQGQVRIPPLSARSIFDQGAAA